MSEVGPPPKLSPTRFNRIGRQHEKPRNTQCYGAFSLSVSPRLSSNSSFSIVSFPVVLPCRNRGFGLDWIAHKLYEFMKLSDFIGALACNRDGLMRLGFSSLQSFERAISEKDIENKAL